MAVKIYFDSTLINEDAIMSLSQEAKLFEDNFVLGSTLCRVVHLDVEKSSVASIPTNVYITDNSNNPLFTLYVDDVNKNNDDYYSFTLVDGMMLFNTVYDWSDLEEPTLQNILDTMCLDILGTTAPTISYMADLELTWNQNIMARDLISYIAEVNSGYARINEENVLEFCNFTNSAVDTIDVDTCEDFTLGEYVIIDRVVYENGIATAKYPSDGEYVGTGSTVYINPDNILLTDSQGYTRDAIVENIYVGIGSVYFYNITTSRCEIDDSVQAGDCIAFTLNGNTYRTFAQIDWKYNGGWYGGYSLDVQTKKQEETSVLGLGASIERKVNITIDREVGLIQQEVTQLSTEVDNSVATITYAYAYGTSETTAPSDSSFTYNTMPALVDGSYIWRRTTFTKNDGNSTKQYEMIQGVGERGASISELEDLHYLQSPQEHTVSGSILTVNDATVATPMELSLKYEPIQDTNGYGKNLFAYKSGLASSSKGGGSSWALVNTDNTILMTATGTAGAQYDRVSLYTGFDHEKKYTFSCKAKKIVKGTSGNPVLRVIAYGSNDYGTDSPTWESFGTTLMSIDNPTQGTEYTLSHTFTGYNNYRFAFYNNSNTPVTVGEQSYYYDIQFEEGETATAFEPFCPTVWSMKGNYNKLEYLGTPSARNGITPSIVTDANGNQKFQLNGKIDEDATNNFYNMNYTSATGKNIATGKWIMKCMNDNVVLQVYKTWQGGTTSWFSETSVGAENQRAFIISESDTMSYIRTLVPNDSTHQFTNEEIPVMIYPLEGTNLYTNGDLIAGKQYNTSGELVVSAARCSTPKYSITGGDSITAVWSSSQSVWSGTRYIILFWDSNNNLLARSTNFTSGTIRVAPSNASYVAFTFYSSGSYDINGDVNELTIISPVAIKPYIPCSNYCPITGRDSENIMVTGKNLLDMSKFISYSASLSVANDAITLTTLTTGTYINAYQELPLSLLGKTLHFKTTITTSSTNTAGIRIRLEKDDGTLIQTLLSQADGSFTLPAILPTGATKMRIRFYVVLTGTTGIGLSATFTQPQLELGSTATTYEPYNGVTNAVSYGSTIYDATYDAVSETLTQRWGMLSTTWGDLSGATVYGSVTRKQIAKPADFNYVDRMLIRSNLAVYDSSNSETSHVNVTSSYIRIYLPTDAPTSAQIQIYYPLSTPTETDVACGDIQLGIGELTNVYSENSRDLTMVYAYDVAPDPPVSKVESTSIAPDVWTLSFPEYQPNSRYWYCMQVTYDDDTVTWTDVVLDGASNGTYDSLESLGNAVANVQVETSSNFEIMSDRISSVVTRTETIEENYIDSETLENTLISKQYATQSDLTQTESNITATFTNYVAKDDQAYVDLTTNIVFDADGINISSSNIDTNLQLSPDGVSIQDGSSNVIASMTPTEFTTGEWVMNQSGYIFNIFRRHN